MITPDLFHYTFRPTEACHEDKVLDFDSWKELVRICLAECSVTVDEKELKKLYVTNEEANDPDFQKGNDLGTQFKTMQLLANHRLGSTPLERLNATITLVLQGLGGPGLNQREEVSKKLGNTIEFRMQVLDVKADFKTNCIPRTLWRRISRMRP